MHSFLPDLRRSLAGHPLSINLVALAVLGCGARDEAPAGGGAAADSPAAQLVERSIAFHDPGEIWGSQAIDMVWFGTGSDGGERVSVDLHFGADQSEFAFAGRYGGSSIEYETNAESWAASVDGQSSPDAETLARMRLDREDGMFWRSYYGFLAGLPMKIADPGARLDPEVAETTFEGRDVNAVRVTYDPEVGGDTWYFYFDPETAELVGCRFYHDESANDGEYITFEGLAEANGLRLPRYREWYTNEGDRFLGSDEIRSVTVR